MALVRNRLHIILVVPIPCKFPYIPYLSHIGLRGCEKKRLLPKFRLAKLQVLLSRQKPCHSDFGYMRKAPKGPVTLKPMIFEDPGPCTGVPELALEQPPA